MITTIEHHPQSTQTCPLAQGILRPTPRSMDTTRDLLGPDPDPTDIDEALLDEEGDDLVSSSALDSRFSEEDGSIISTLSVPSSLWSAHIGTSTSYSLPMTCMGVPFKCLGPVAEILTGQFHFRVSYNANIEIQINPICRNMVLMKFSLGPSMS